MVDVRRHAPVARYRMPRLRQQHAYGLANVSRGRVRHIARDIYESDGFSDRSSRPFRWMLSTLLAAVVGIAASGIAIYGALSPNESANDILAQIERASLTDFRTASLAPGSAGLEWLSPKEGRLQVATSALVIRQIIHDQVRVRRDGKPFLQVKPYLRLSARLAPAPADYAELIPSFNPLKLFRSSPAALATVGGAQSPGFGTVQTEIVDLLDGRLPTDDQQAFEEFEIAAIVKVDIETAPSTPMVRFGFSDEDGADTSASGLINGTPADDRANRITILRRRPSESDGTSVTLEKRDHRIVTATDGDTVSSVLTTIGASDWQARSIEAAVQRVRAKAALGNGDQLHVTTVPSLESPNSVDVLKLSIFADGHLHRASVRRTSSGQFVASDQPDQDALIRAMSNDSEAPLSTLYAAVYGLGLTQDLSGEQIMSIIRTHAHDVDFQRAVQPGDQLELFFDLEHVESGEPKPAELFYSALTTNGETRRFWRFRSHDGSVDYFDAEGQNARKFLLRKPVSGGGVRFTSGFGMRRHPLLNRMRPHNGIDWAARSGTPIIAGGRGTISFAGRRGASGNMIRIRHANGYETAYLHMSRFAPGMRVGRRVRQGEVIGYVGTTGLSSGPHLHYEVRVNNRYVDPLKIKVGQERNLKERELIEFQRERERLTRVMRSPPVRTAQSGKS